MKSFEYKDEFTYYEANSIELLGYAKNNIAEAEEKISGLPINFKKNLQLVNKLLTEIQEYLFTH